MSKKFIRRSLLFVPGSSEKMLNKALTLEVDSLILDLEDSVSIQEKEDARKRVSAYIAKVKANNKEAIVRVNGMDTMWGILDLLEIAKEQPDAVLIPKADEKALVIADGILSAAEVEKNLPPNSITMIPLFETAYVIVHAASILSVSERIDGVQLGAEDLTKELEIERTTAGKEIWYARHQLATAARARKIDILDTPYTAIYDVSGLENDISVARQIGFTGKTCIYPGHLAAINAAFSPKEEEISYAKGLLEVFEAALAEGKGACMYQNKMIDAPIAERARKIIEKAERIKHLGKVSE